MTPRVRTVSRAESAQGIAQVLGATAAATFRAATRIGAKRRRRPKRRSRLALSDADIRDLARIVRKLT